MKSTNLLKAWRERRHISQEKFGAMIGLTGAMVSHVETGRHSPSLSTFEAIHNATGLSLKMLLRFFLEKQSAGIKNPNTHKSHRRKA